MSFLSLNPTADRFCGVSVSDGRHPWVVVAACMIALALQLAPADCSAQLKFGGNSTPAAGSVNRNQDSGSDTKQQGMPPEKAFRFMLEKITKNEAEVNRLFSSMPLGFPERQQKIMKMIDAFEAETKMLKANLSQAAFASFKAAPGADPLATQFVYRSLTEMLDPTLPESTFDPASALEIVDVMMDNGADGDPVALAKGFRASFALEDFDRASMMLDRIAEASPEGNLTSIRQVVDDSKEKWQRELMIRRLEKNNDDLPKVKFETTAGDFTVVLYENHAPNTVANFVSLVEKKFYNDLNFHYVKPGEYIHGGSPNGDATGGPGYRIASEVDREQTRDYFAGTLGMANTGPDTEGSQFVITHQRMPELDGQFTAFGRVIEGFDVVLGMTRYDAADPPQVGPGEQAQGPVVINRATVLSKRDHDYSPKKITAPAANDGMGTLGQMDLDEADDSLFRQSSNEGIPSGSGGLFEPAQR